MRFKVTERGDQGPLVIPDRCIGEPAVPNIGEVPPKLISGINVSTVGAHQFFITTPCVSYSLIYECEDCAWELYQTTVPLRRDFAYRTQGNHVNPVATFGVFYAFNALSLALAWINQEEKSIAEHLQEEMRENPFNRVIVTESMVSSPSVARPYIPQRWGRVEPLPEVPNAEDPVSTSE